MSIIGLIMNLILIGLLLAALGVGLRLNRRLRVLKDSQDGFQSAVQELNAAAARAEQGLADLRAATDEAVDELGDRIEKGRALAQRLERLLAQKPVVAAAAGRRRAAPVEPVGHGPLAARRAGRPRAAAGRRA